MDVQVFGIEPPALMFLADVFVYINTCFHGKLFHDRDGKMAEKDIVLVEADHLKALLTKLRRLWRAVPNQARNEHVKALKQMVTESNDIWAAHGEDAHARRSMVTRCRSQSQDPSVKHLH